MKTQSRNRFGTKKNGQSPVGWLKKVTNRFEIRRNWVQVLRVAAVWPGQVTECLWASVFSFPKLGHYYLPDRGLRKLNEVCTRKWWPSNSSHLQQTCHCFPCRRGWVTDLPGPTSNQFWGFGHRLLYPVIGVGWDMWPWTSLGHRCPPTCPF